MLTCGVLLSQYGIFLFFAGCVTMMTLFIILFLPGALASRLTLSKFSWTCGACRCRIVCAAKLDMSYLYIKTLCRHTLNNW